MERYFIQSLILSQRIPDEIPNILGSNDLRDDFYRKAYRAILRLAEVNKPVDRFSLNEELNRAQDIDSLFSTVESDLIVDPVRFANLIRKDNLQAALSRAVQQKDTVEIKRLAEQIEGLTTSAPGFRSISEIARQPSEQFLLSIDTGFYDLDEYAHFNPGDLVVVAGRTGIGKTTLGLNMLCNMTWECPVGLITLEMEGRRIVRRMDKFLSKERIQELSELFFVAEPPPVLPEILSAIHEMAHKARIKCVMIDYLQLITDSKKGIRNRNQEISHVVREIKNFAKKTGIVAILVSQLSRMIDHRDKKNQKPVLADLKECVVGGTSLQTDKGERSIKHLFDKNMTNFRVKSLNPESGQIGYVKPAKIVHSGIQKCLRIRTGTEKIIVLSENTGLYDGEKWILASNLKPGDRVIVGSTGQSSSFLDEVTEVSEAGELDTYDMVIPRNHCFFANEVLVHNSGDIEYASDIVLLIHRPFPLQSNDPIEAELIIAKNRDGRRAVVDLIWNPNQVRYENKRNEEAVRSQED